MKSAQKGRFLSCEFWACQMRWTIFPTRGHTLTYGHVPVSVITRDVESVLRKCVCVSLCLSLYIYKYVCVCVLSFLSVFTPLAYLPALFISSQHICLPVRWGDIYNLDPMVYLTPVNWVRAVLFQTNNTTTKKLYCRNCNDEALGRNLVH